MRVYGYKISQTVIDKIVDKMKNEGPVGGKAFTNYDVDRWLKQEGVPTDPKGTYRSVSYRAADRIIQQQRKENNIVYDRKNGWWTWRRQRQKANSTF